MHTINQKLFAVHGAGALIGGVNRRAHPLEIANHIAGDAGMNIRGLRRELRPGFHADNGLGKIVGRRCA